MAKSKADWRQDAIDCVRSLRNSGAILHPTDTVWGLAAHSCDEEAVKKIFDIKQRELHETLLMLVDSEQMMEQLLPQLPEAAWELIQISDRPITIAGRLNDKCRFNFASGMVRDDGSIAVRLVNDPFLSFLIQGINAPLASTSANLSNQPTPANYASIDTAITSQVDHASPYRRNSLNSSTPSMLVHFDEAGRMKILRS